MFRTFPAFSYPSPLVDYATSCADATGPPLDIRRKIVAPHRLSLWRVTHPPSSIALTTSFKEMYVAHHPPLPAPDPRDRAPVDPACRRHAALRRGSGCRSMRSPIRCRRSSKYLPYRHRDGTHSRDNGIHAYFAGHGYASIRVDIRGSGESEGVLLDEYLRQEQDDALDVIAWIARQPWSTGKVGMMGISWGGFNSLQVAARRPPALKAIITVDSTDDRYTPTTRTTWEARCSARTWAGAAPSSCSRVARPIRRSSGATGSRCGSGA